MAGPERCSSWPTPMQTITRRWAAAAEARLTGKPAGRRRRRRWARSIQQLLDRAIQTRSGSQFPHPKWEAPLRLRTDVVNACRSDLRVIQSGLLDGRQHIPGVALRQLKVFLTDPSASPLFGPDPFVGRRAARQLRHTVMGTPEKRDQIIGFAAATGERDDE
jgi:hypothetical protein